MAPSWPQAGKGETIHQDQEEPLTWKIENIKYVQPLMYISVMLRLEIFLERYNFSSLLYKWIKQGVHCLRVHSCSGDQSLLPLLSPSQARASKQAESATQ